MTKPKIVYTDKKGRGYTTADIAKKLKIGIPSAHRRVAKYKKDGNGKELFKTKSTSGGGDPANDAMTLEGLSNQTDLDKFNSGKINFNQFLYGE